MPHIKDYLLTRTPPLWLTIIILLIGLPLLLPFLYILFRAIEVGLGRSLELLIRPRIGGITEQHNASHGLCNHLDPFFLGYRFVHFLLERYRFFWKIIFLKWPIEFATLYSSLCELFLLGLASPFE